MLALAVLLCACQNAEDDRRPELSQPPASDGRNIVAAPQQAESPYFVLQRAESESASAYATAESTRYRLQREEFGP